MIYYGWYATEPKEKRNSEFIYKRFHNCMTFLKRLPVSQPDFVLTEIIYEILTIYISVALNFHVCI